VSGEYHHEPRLDVQALLQARGTRILDVGCGAGAMGAALKRQGASWVAGVEGHPAAAAEARTHLDLVVAGDLMSAPLPFARGEFDALVFADVLEHVPDPAAALARYLPFLAAEGRVVVSVPNMRFYLVLWRLLRDRWEYTDSGIRDRTHLRIFTRRSLHDLLRGAGLQVERLQRNQRLFEDQSHITRAGVVAHRLALATVGLVFRDLMAFQYVAVARRAAAPPARP
jgi:2-polyprenyl-3-methyl-5-hydroxy-6-metoxy-1,4-benzoquinol methylase